MCDVRTSAIMTGKKSSKANVVKDVLYIFMVLSGAIYNVYIYKMEKACIAIIAVLVADNSNEGKQLKRTSHVSKKWFLKRTKYAHHYI